MRALKYVVLVLMVALLGSAAPSLAGKRVALVVGNGAYTSVSALSNPVNDASLMARTLEGVGFEVTLVSDANQLEMRQAMLEFGRQLRTDVDASLFYYAGHGVQARGQNFLIPVDANINDESELDFQAVDVNAFLRVMESSSSRVNIVVLDACRNNPFKSGFRASTRGLAMLDAPKGTYIAYSTAPGEVAEDGSTGNSPYTTALTNAITAPGLKIEDVFKQARAGVLEMTSERQVPWETSSITGDFYFVPGAPGSGSTSSEVATRTEPLFKTDATAAMAWSAIQGSVRVNDYRAFVETFGASSPFLKGLAESRIAALESQQAVTPPTTLTPPASTRSGGRLVPQTAHFDWVRTVDWSPDGRRIASSSDDATVRVWDVATGALMATLSGHGDWVYTVDWSPDGRQLASADRDGQVIIWDVESTNIARRWQAEAKALTVAWSPDGSTLAVGGYSGEAEIWDVRAERLISSLDGHDDWVRKVAWSPDGRQLATASDDGFVKVWNVSAGTLLHTLTGHDTEEYVKSVAWSPDGTRLASASEDATLRIWDARSGAALQVIDSFEEKVLSVDWSPDGRVIATSDQDSTAKLFDAESGRLILAFDDDAGSTQSVAWSPDGRQIATGGSDDRVRIWDPLSGSQRAIFQPDLEGAQFIAASGTDNLVAVVGVSGNIDIWDLSRGSHVQHIATQSGGIKSIAWSPDGRSVATGGTSRNVRVYDPFTGRLMHDLEGHSDWIRSVAWSPDSRQLISGSDDKTAIIWSMTDGSRVRTLEGHTDWIRAVAWAERGGMVATGADDDKILLWNAGTGTLNKTIEVDTWPRQVAFSPDGTKLLSAHGSQEAFLWDTGDGTQLQMLQSRGGSIHSVAWSRDGVLMAVDNLLFDTSGRPAGTIGEHSGQVHTAFWSPQGAFIGAAQNDLSVEIYAAGSRQYLMTFLFGGSGKAAIIYPDDTVYLIGDASSLFRLVEDGEIKPSLVGYEHLFRRQASLPR